MLSLRDETYIEKDLKTIWHPFTKGLNPPTLFVRGKDTCLYTREGEAYIDAISSWWVNLHGHAHPYIASKIAKQVHLLEHVIFTDFTHEPAIDYSERLLKVLPAGFSRIFYSDNGATAVEIALKMAIQFFYNLGVKKKKIISLKGGYHGDTFGAMSVAGIHTFNLPFHDFLFETINISPPMIGQEEKSLKEMEAALSDDVLCFIYEPIIQGASGMRIYSHEGLNALLAMVKSRGALLIADEVFTGFGRCGPFFVSDMLETKPDLIALSKGITGGFLPLGATVVKEELFATFLENTFFHGHSYSGNPIALVAALASLDLLEKPSCFAAREKIASHHETFCQKWREHPKLKRVESLGTILAIEYFENPPTKQFFHDHNIILRPLGNVYCVTPPYCIEDEELAKIYRTLEKTWT